MNWITAGFLMFFASVASYPLVRLSFDQQPRPEHMNLFMFGVPAILYGVIAYSTHADLTVTPYQFVVILVLAIFFSFLGNKFSLKSIEFAPNPGYSLVISKSYVVFTSIAAVYLFDSQLTLRAMVAIAIIIVCSALITIDKKGAKHASHVRSSWLPLSLGAFFCWGMLTITSKYLLTIGVGSLPRLLYSMGLVTVFILVESLWKRLQWRELRSSQIMTLFFIGVSSAVFNWGMQEGFRLAPNIGYINAMNASSMGFVVIGAAIFFRDDLTPRKLLGVFGAIVGLIILVL